MANEKENDKNDADTTEDSGKRKHKKKRISADSKTIVTDEPVPVDEEPKEEPITDIDIDSDIFAEYKQEANTKQITQTEVDLSNSIYERLISQVPAECIAVSVIMECIIEQVLANTDDDSTKTKPTKNSLADVFNENIGSEWNLMAYPKKRDPTGSISSLGDSSQSSKRPTTVIKPHFDSPKIIKSCDYADMRTAHLPEEFGPHLASSQVTGDFHRLETVLWHSAPKFNKGFHMKLLGNLNHFMYFLPPSSIHIDDMFFILHLLMSAGVEEHLKKTFQTKPKFSEELTEPLSLLIKNYIPVGSGDGHIPDTHLLADHNYLTISDVDALHFILEPLENNGSVQMTISQLGQTTHFKEEPQLLESPPPQEGEEEEEDGEEEEEESEGGENEQEESENAQSDRKLSDSSTKQEETRKSSTSSTTSKKGNRKSSNKSNQGTTKADQMRISEVIAEENNEEEEQTNEDDDLTNKKEFGSQNEDGFREGENITEDKEQAGVETFDNQKTKRFIPCDEQFLTDDKSFNLFSSLLECSALLISESGAMDLSKWADMYLECRGLPNGAADGMITGNLKNWNFVEEYGPVQMIQVLNEAMGDYLSMQRMYCPFYDTTIFTFNNPMPHSLQSETSFICKLQMIQGIQGFLEFTINDEAELQRVIELGKSKGVEPVESFSIQKLLKLVPEIQWEAAPNIKEKVLIKKMEWEKKIAAAEENAMQQKIVEKKTFEKIAKEKEIQEVAPMKPEIKKSEIVEEKRKPGEEKRTNDKSKRKGTRKTSMKDKEFASKIELPPKERKFSKKEPEEEEKLLKEPEQVETETNSLPKHKRSNKTIKDKTSDISVPVLDENQYKAFQCYDLGKRVVVTAVDTFYMFPMDGSVIQYQIATIEKDLQMMQFSIGKSGHNAYFYPYYIPRNADTSKTSYIVCPYFHVVHNNGTMFSFQSDYRKTPKPPETVSTESQTDEATEPVLSPPENTSTPTSDEQPVTTATEIAKEEITKDKEEDMKNLKDDKQEQKDINEPELEKGHQVKKTKKGKEKKKGVRKVSSAKIKKDSKEKIFENPEKDEESVNIKPVITEDIVREEFVYPDSENSDEDDEKFIGAAQKIPKRRMSFNTQPHTKGEQTIKPLAHSFKVTLPSGLIIQLLDVKNPLNRQVKQWYAAKGSADFLVESSRCYCSNGSVVKFMMNSTVQILTARCVTTTVREVVSNVDITKKQTEKRSFSNAKVKVFEGEIVLSTGERWAVINGEKQYQDPLLVFSESQISNSEIFQRRQDGVIYFHRQDGTVICHYPDGTRFTTKTIIMKRPVEEFEDWVFVGFQYMVEHPNYATVLFNSLSGNVNLKLPYGDWVRIYADGIIKVSTDDNCTLDVNQYQAKICYPPCIIEHGDDNSSIPNTTIVQLFRESDYILNGSGTNEAVGVPSSSESFTKETEEALSATEIDVRGSPEEQMSITEQPNSPTDNGEVNEILRASALETDIENEIKNSSSEEKSETSITSGEFLTTSVVDVLMEEHHEIVEEPAGDLGDSRFEKAQKLKQVEMEQKQTNIEEFLRFTDLWTFCKSVDSWENKFCIDLFGEKTVDKTCGRMSNDNMEHFMSDEVRSGSNEGTLNSRKAIRVKKRSSIGNCGKMPKTKIFVLKRDLNGYQFLTQSHIDSILQKAKSHRESTVVTDNRSDERPSKFITIMEPVGINEKPNGTWHSTYSEPVFRPRHLHNKQLKIALPEDLRWFGHIIPTTQKKRQKSIFVPTENLGSKTELEAESLSKETIEVSSVTPEDEEEGTQNETLNEFLSVADAENEEDFEDEGLNKSPSDNVVDGLIDEEGSEGSVEEILIQKERSSLKVSTDDIEEPVKDVLDVEGIHDLDTEVKPRVKSQEHAELCTRHKAIVVRSFSEIPKIDENMQRSLIAASTCYAKTIENQLNVYKSYEINDPKFEEERKRQKFIKQQLIEQNIEDMHLYEQSQGKVLSFHF